jgi:glycosyltransferase involved in cell wall biosynthesis
MNQTVPAISVITIVKNNEKLLPRAISSVLSQIFPDFEYIIVNDGSTDSTQDIIADFAAKDDRLQPQHMARNVGRAIARNAGLDRAKGRYIFFLDSDDYLPENALGDLYETAEKDNVDIVYAGIKGFDQATLAWKPHHYTDNFINHERHNFRLDEYADLINNHAIIGRLYRRKFLENHCIRFSTTRKNGEDVTFAFYTACYASSMSMVPGRVVYYYNCGNYLASANASKVVDARDNIIETLEFAKKNCSKDVVGKVQAKAAIFAGNLDRARIVFGLSEQLQVYVSTLVPLVEGISDDVLKVLPPYHQDYAKFLIAGDFAAALRLFEQRERERTEKKKEGRAQIAYMGYSNTELRSEAGRLRKLNSELAHRLDTLYDSTSWRVTKPLRAVMKVLRRG